MLYDFRPGVRGRLLSTLTRGESAEVLRVLAGVSHSVASTFGTLDFRALAALADTARTGAPVLPAHSVPFAEVAVEVLRGLGGADGALAERLAVTLPAGARVGPAAEATDTRHRPAGQLVVPITAQDILLEALPQPARRRWWQRGAAAPAPVPQSTGRPAEAGPTWSNLPPDRPDMTGRESELVEVERILHPGSSASAARSADRPAPPPSARSASSRARPGPAGPHWPSPTPVCTGSPTRWSGGWTAAATNGSRGPSPSSRPSRASR
ncbi:hypothetical protein [Kitasatospora sp. NPDC091207]|uniref:hypothetical protein n=1 Tax=Kitasatospora sp. NPDC091207 TaxID=3364083 RepID=UPI0038096440